MSTRSTNAASCVDNTQMTRGPLSASHVREAHCDLPVQESYCVKCPEANYDTAACRGKTKCTVFHSKTGEAVRPEERTAFASECLPKAFHANGTIKSELKCTGKDARLAAAVVMSF